MGFDYNNIEKFSLLINKINTELAKSEPEISAELDNSLKELSNYKLTLLETINNLNEMPQEKDLLGRITYQKDVVTSLEEDLVRIMQVSQSKYPKRTNFPQSSSSSVEPMRVRNLENAIEIVTSQPPKEGFTIDPFFQCDKNTLARYYPRIKDLISSAENFNVAVFLIGPYGKAAETDENDYILNVSSAEASTIAHILQEEKGISLENAYKLIVGIVDKIDEVEKVLYREDQTSSPKSSYPLRTALLLASQQDGAALESWMVYTKNGKPDKSEIWPFLGNWNNWVPEAQGAMAKFTEVTLIEAKKLAEQNPDQKVFLLKGGFGAGKTRLTEQIFPKNTRGVSSPDKGKNVVRRSLVTVPHSKAHVQGSQISYTIFNDMINKMSGTIVYDSALSRPSDIKGYLEKCEKSGKKMEIHDVGRHDMARFLSVLKREILGTEPRVPTDSILYSAMLDKTNRVECINIVLNHVTQEGAPIPEYHFYGGDERGWNTREIMVIKSNNSIEFKSPELTDDNRRRLEIEGIHITDSGIIESTVKEDELRAYYEEQFERPVGDIIQDLSQEEGETLTRVFSNRTLDINEPGEINNSSALYLQLSDRFKESISQNDFCKAIDALKEQTKINFFASITDRISINYLDLPLKAALNIHQNLSTDPWIS